MKKISIILLAVSIIFYLIFYFVLFDAPSAVSITSFLLCLALSIGNLVISICSLARVGIRDRIPIWLAVLMFMINIPVFLFFTFYVMVMFFVPFRISIG